MTKDQEQICKVLKGMFKVEGFHEHTELKKEDSIIVEFKGPLNDVMAIYGFIGLINWDKPKTQIRIFSQTPVPDKDKPILFQFGDDLNQSKFADIINRKIGLGLPVIHAQFTEYGR